MRARTLPILFVLLVGLGSLVFAQTSSHRQQPMVRYRTLENSSWYFQEPAPPRKIKLHDVVTVLVEQSSKVISDGQVDRRRTSVYQSVLKDWIKLDGLSLKPAAQTDGDPKASGTSTQTYRTEAELEATDRMTFKIAATVVDIKPNGNLVLEAHSTVQFNHEIWDASLTGIIRPDDVLPNNTVLSEDVAEMSIYKRQRGHVRDGYKRGWLTRIFDSINPF